MPSDLYKIKPLVWKQDQDRTRCFRADTPFGQCVVRGVDGEGWDYTSCFSRYWNDCNSLAHGKQLAEQHYREWLMGALEKVEVERCQ